jgi:hypothetical protein
MRERAHKARIHNTSLLHQHLGPLVRMGISKPILSLIIMALALAIGFAFVTKSVAVGLQTLTLIGVLVAVWAVLQAKEDLRAQTVMKLTDGWRSFEIYDATKYILYLETEFKEYCARPKGSAEWKVPAEKWVKDHLNQENQKVKEESNMRRTLAQFLSKMGLMAISGYIKWDDLFGVIPEMGRYLAVLVPIELEIVQHWRPKENERIADWDVPVAKWEFTRILEEYIAWQKRKSSELSLGELDYS